MGKVVIAGAGIGGLATALYLSRAGHEVVLVERDDTPLPASAAEAFWWDRRGAPQVRHSHAFLARLRNQLLADHPDVLAALIDAGATELDFIAMLPEGMDRTPMPGDDELVALACRRTTFEWVLRRSVLADPLASLRHGVAVSGLHTAEPPPGADPTRAHVDGLVVDGGEVIPADLVVLAGGRRMDIPAMCAEIGGEVDEREQDTGIVYLSRFMCLRDGAEIPAQLGPIGGDLGYLKYAVFAGDNRTFSLTLAVDSSDRELRRRLADPEVFLRAVSALPATAAHVDGRSEPMTDVEVMGGLINRRRRFTDADGQPLVGGMVALGDAHTATNPLYGRGCSLAFVQAGLLAEAIESTGGFGLEAAAAYEESSQREVDPWYRAAVAQDRFGDQAARRPERDGSTQLTGSDDAGDPATDSAAEIGSGVADPDGGVAGADPGIQPEFMRSLLEEGLRPAIRDDPVVLRAFLAMFNLLRPPDALMTDQDVLGRIMAAYQDRHNREPEPALGPGRAEFIELLG
ncbi:MAG: FAD-dependent monooxygenase [Microthrixaceae bacterium]